MAASILPSSYEEWRHCIPVKCKVARTATYVDQRIAALRNAASDEVRSFRRWAPDDQSIAVGSAEGRVATYRGTV